MKILFDTNVIIDSLSAREPYNKEADAVFEAIAIKTIAGYVTISSITDIYYILCKTFSDADSRSKVRILLNLLHVIEVKETDCLAALDSYLPDFEDALIVACFERENLDFIVTRDIDFLKFQKALTPGEFLDKIE